jgi:SAM-dependent methyltransferase
MNLHDILHRNPTPAPWAEGEKIPWNEPEFSRRMLREHLSQSHDLASRRSTIIDQHIAWINQEILQGKKANILDLGCGPGLYCHRLAAQGHTCTGVDFSPASIGYAQENSHPNARYIEGDVRTTPFSPGYTLVMMLFGEFNVFTPTDARRILQKAFAALITGGILLLEAHTFDCVRRLGQTPPSWYSAARGVFSDEPYLCLKENFWHAAPKVAVERYYVLDAASGDVSRYTQSIQAYENEAYTQLLQGIGYTDIHIYPSLTGATEPTDNNLLVITARKPTLIP